MRPLASIDSSLPPDGVSGGVNTSDIRGHTEQESQLTLRYDGSHTLDGAWALMLEMIRAIVQQLGPKQVAFDLDISPSYLNHCLNERERHNVPAKWLPYFLTKAKDDDLAAFVALLRGRKLSPRVELTPAQKLERLLAAMGEQLGPDMRALLINKAFGESK